MSFSTPNSRKAGAEVDPQFLDRWSPRDFDGSLLSDSQVASLFEAARWAPSCFNEQPWVFVIARAPEDKARFLEALTEKNRTWAASASLLCFALARTQFSQTGKNNRWAFFDTGAAWMSLALQARKMGLYAHAMAGFSEDKARQILGASPADYLICAAIAIGRRKVAEQTESGKDDVRPSDRKEAKDFLFEPRLSA